MRVDYEATAEYIKDLETLNDLQAEEIAELKEQMKVMKAQIQSLLLDCRFPDLKVG